MALRLTLRPRERMIISGAVIRNGNSRAEFYIENEVPVLRETDIIRPTSVRSPCERIYLALQLMYVDPDAASNLQSSFRALLAEVLAAAPSSRPLLDNITEMVSAGRLYQALKHARALLEYEKELKENAA